MRCKAIRERIRARDAAVDDLRRRRQSISSLMLRYGRSYPGKKTWGAWHRQWLQAQRFEHPAEQCLRGLSVTLGNDKPQRPNVLHCGILERREFVERTA